MINEVFKTHPSDRPLSPMGWVSPEILDVQPGAVLESWAVVCLDSRTQIETVQRVITVSDVLMPSLSV